MDSTKNIAKSKSSIPEIPNIDISPLLQNSNPSRTILRSVGKQIFASVNPTSSETSPGCFFLINHGIPKNDIQLLCDQSFKFFNLSTPEKSQISLAKGGKAWRGWFPLGDELTSGKPDQKSGIYFGQELPQDHPLPLHGPNLFPSQLPDLKTSVVSFMSHCHKIGMLLMSSIASMFDKDTEKLLKSRFNKPTELFRVFHYPPADANDLNSVWGVGEHTDYGCLTILLVTSPGLQVKSTSSQWIDVPFHPYRLIVNFGDMLDSWTQGKLRATPHRVKNISGAPRLSFPFFFDCNWDSPLSALPSESSDNSSKSTPRWDNQNLAELSHLTYGQFLLSKVSKVFPQLAHKQLD